MHNKTVKKPWNPRVNLPPGPGPGRPKGSKDKLPRNVKDTILHVWKTLQDDPKRSLMALARKKPAWFYELTKGCFPRSIEFSIDINLDLLSRPELENQLRTLLEVLQAGNRQQIIDVTPEALPGPSDDAHKV